MEKYSHISLIGVIISPDTLMLQLVIPHYISFIPFDVFSFMVKESQQTKHNITKHIMYV